MTGLGRIEIGHSDAEQVRIEVVSHEPDEWRVTSVEVACGIWRGAFRWQFHSGELRKFGLDIEELHRTLTGTVILDPMEPNLTLKMIGDGKGHITVEGRAQPEFYARTYLVFSIALDQTELPPIAAALLSADPG